MPRLHGEEPGHEAEHFKAAINLKISLRCQLLQLQLLYLHRRRKVGAGGARAPPPISRRWGLNPLKNNGL